MLLGKTLDEDQVWAVTVGGKQMLVADLPIRVMEAICTETDTNYAWVCTFPFADLRVAEKVIFQAAKLLEVESPDFDTLTTRALGDFFVPVADDLPEEFENGVPPVGGD